MADYIINDNETIFANQINNGWLNTFKANKKLPVIAKRLFATYASAKKFVDTSTDTAIPGLVLSVFNDPDPSKNGIYFVKQAAGVDGATVGILEPAGAGAGSISVNTYEDAVKEIKVDATTSEVKNLGQVIYIKTATGTVGQADYKPAGAYVVTGATTLEKLGTSISGDLSSDVAGIRTDLGTRPENTQDAFTEIGGLKTLVGTTAVATQIDNAIKALDVEDTNEDGKYVTGVTQTDGKITVAKDTLATSLQSNNTKPITSGAVYTAFDGLDKAVVKSIKSGSAEAVTPVNGVATITYDERLNETSTNAPQTKVVQAAYASLNYQIGIIGKGAKLSILTPDTISDASVLKRYVFYQGRDSQDPTNAPGTVVGTIDIPKDLVVTSGEIVIGDGNNGTILNEQYLKLNIGNGEPVYIAVKDLVDVYTSGNYITVGDDNKISVNIPDVDAKLAEDTSVVGGRIKAVENDIATLYTDDFTKEGTIVKIISEATEKLIEGTAADVENHALSELKAVAEAAYTPGGDKIAREDLDDSTKASLGHADRAIIQISTKNKNQINVSKAMSDVTITPVTVSSDELVKVGTKDEVAGSPEKLLTAGIAKEYIDSLWDWEMLD